MYSKIALASILFSAAHGQQVGTLTAETHPSLTWQACTAPGACTDKAGKVVLDSNWRWLHDSTGYVKSISIDLGSISTNSLSFKQELLHWEHMGQYSLSRRCNLHQELRS